MSKTKIEWCDWTWNPVWGCFNNCPYCYARNIAKRFGKQICGRDDFFPTWIEKNFQKPIPKNVTHIFVNSMSDIAFWKKIWIEKLWSKMAEYPEKKFILLTKDCGLTNCGNLENVYFGNTANNNEMLNMMPPRNPIVSIEPIFEKIDTILLKSKKWIIVGAETGNRKGKVIPKTEWIEEIREFCQTNGIKLFEKDSLKDIVKRPLIQQKI